jgi:DNA-binding beta-propeller fold protein YncE
MLQQQGGIKMRLRKLYGLLILMTAVTYGCATTGSKEVTNLFWPAPPDEPRIAYLRSYRGAADLQKKNFFDAIFGAPAVPGFRKAYGVYAQGDKIYVSLASEGPVVVMDTKEQKVSYVGDSGSGRLALSIGVAAASDGTVFVSDAKQKKVFGYDSQGNLKFAIGKKDEFKNPAGIAINNELGRLYVVDSHGHSVHVYSLKGEKLFHFGTDGEKDGEFHYPSNVAIDRRNGKVYVVDTQNFRIQVFDQDGKFISKFGQLGDAAGAFSRPKGIGVDTEGHVYVADAAFDNFQVFDENGQLLLFIGSAGRDPGQFQLPAGLYVDEKDRIYVVDSLNGRVQVFQYLSEKWKKENPEQYKKYLLTESKKQEASPK